MKMETKDLTQDNIEKIEELFPEVVTEAIDPSTKKVKKAIDFDVLRQLFSDSIVEGSSERYNFTWPGKNIAIFEACSPITKTLRPCKELSVNWEFTKNLYIEGDNLDALKLLQESFLNSIKLIYIDPPYNTGNDFVYKDDFHIESNDYSELIGEIDDIGSHLFKNTETNGRFHSDWCSMVYPRLKLSRSLLSEDGAIFISIDDNEIENLRKMCDEIFGEFNFVTQFVWSAGRKNDSKLVSVSHEYIVCYVKSKKYHQEHNILWRERKQGLDEIYSTYDKLRKQYGSDDSKVESELKKWYKSIPKTHPAANHTHYCNVDENGIYFASDISWPGGGGPTYEVLHPLTKKPVRIPSRGWIYPSSERMQEMINAGKIHFGPDETHVPCIKSYLKEREFTAPYSTFYKDGRAATKRLRELMGADVFENPKDEEILQDIIEFTNTKDSIILDFFSGSGTTAHAMFLQNAIDDGNRNFIMIQIPEKIDEKSNAYKVGYRTISEIGMERIRRAGRAIAKGDVGFRVFKIDDSNMKDVYYSSKDYKQSSIDGSIDNIKEDRTDLDLLYGVLLDWGLKLSLPIEKIKIDSKDVYSVDSKMLVACFAYDISESVIREISKMKPTFVVFRDSSFKNLQDKINLEELFKNESPETTIKVI